MRFVLTEREQVLLRNAKLEFLENYEYTDDEALLLLDQIRAVEVSYAQYSGGVEEQLYFEYGDIADKIHKAIPDFEG